jgi:hypothetical protein
MKTLGQIARDEFFNDNSWTDCPVHPDWDRAAQAVRAQVIEECAKEMERRAEIDLYAAHEYSMAADYIRLLKEKKETT